MFLNRKYLEDYIEKQPITLQKHFDKLKKVGSTVENFNFYFSNSAVYSSMIEGNSINLDSYYKYSHSGMNTNGKSFTEIEDLKAAYSFAKDSKLTLENVLEAHKILTNTLIQDQKYRGEIRDKDVYIFSNGVKIYTGASKDIVNQELTSLFTAVEQLLTDDLTLTESFYFASFIHLYFAQIHPFADGNGRTARLVEKWFLAQKLGTNAWFIQSEKLYQKRLKMYYKTINLGENYSTLNYNLALDFLCMLPMALRLK